MKKKSAPAFQFYPADWISSSTVSLLSLAAEGAYIRALGFCWLHGSLPADRALLARLIGKEISAEILDEIIPLFTPHEGRLIHDRLEDEREKQKAWREKSARGGRQSRPQANNNQTTTNRKPIENQNETLHSPSSSPSTW